MPQLIRNRSSAVLLVGAAMALIAAAPAPASEGPQGPAPDVTPPAAFAPATFLPFTIRPAAAKPARVVKRARLVPRRVRRGHRARLRVSLRVPSRLRIVMSRRVGGRRVRIAALAVPAAGRRVSLRLPARSKGRRLAPGRYRIDVVAIDAQGKRARPVRLTLVVRRGR